ncbi:MAG: hypothetical protein AB2421_18345 [Thermotaleaceae bacterium]
MDINILFYLVLGFGLLFSLSLFFTLYSVLAEINFVPKKSKNVFFTKSELDTINFSANARKKNLIEKGINKVIDIISGYFDMDKINKNIERANKKGIENVANLIINSFMYAAALFATLLFVRHFIFDMGIIKILNILAIPIGFYIPFSEINAEIKKKDKEIKIEIPEVLDLIRQGVGAGLLFIDAIKEARPQNGGAVDRLLKDVIAEIETSGDHILAINKMGEKINDEKIREFLQQLTIAVDADRDRQIEICAALAKSVRELEIISKNLQIDSVAGFLKTWQYTAVVVAGGVFITFALYDTYIRFQ